MLELAWEPSKLLLSPTPSTVLLHASFATCCLCFVNINAFGGGFKPDLIKHVILILEANFAIINFAKEP